MTLSRLLSGLVVLCLVFGLGYRLAPLVLGPDALARFFVTEDGYLMLTVARNLAIGNGLSVSDGTIATNGVQPLATLIYAIPYLVTGGAKVASLAGIVAIMAAISVAAAAAIRAFAGQVLSGRRAVWAWLVTALWFVGPLLLFHSMNALETGLYTGLVAATMAYFAHVTAAGGLYTLRRQILLGCFCGLVFLSRIDGAFLVTALFLVRFVHVQASGQATFRQAVTEALPPGLISLVFAAPWLLHNQIFFGSIMPISGPAQSIDAAFGENLSLVPAKLFETMLPMLPIPTGLEYVWPVQTVAVIVTVGILAVFLWRLGAARNPTRVAVWAYVVYGLFLSAYYGLFFGAEHFLSRYFAPLAPLMITAAIFVALDLADRAFNRWPRLEGAGAGPVRLRGGGDLVRVTGAGALVLSVLLLVRLALPGVKDQGHFQVVGWVEENVAEATWVGAVQTGTLGYWHDRTINLDGKVNPEALAARIEDGDILDYVTGSRIDVIADWVGMAAWVDLDNAAFTNAFEVVVADPAQNLAVLRRTGGGDGDETAPGAAGPETGTDGETNGGATAPEVEAGTDTDTGTNGEAAAPTGPQTEMGDG